jgi:hypothetical protein
MSMSVSEESEHWARQEFASSDFGDARLNERMKKIASSFLGKPDANIPLSCKVWSCMKATYRFLSNPKVSLEKIITPHATSTKSRARGEKVLLAPQDTSILDYTDHPATEGLGYAGNLNQLGCLIHLTLLATCEGTPLGMIDLNIWSREATHEEVSDMQAKGKKGRAAEKYRKAMARTIEEKESFRWLESFRKTCLVQKELGEGVMVVNICDREGDFYDLFAEALSEGSPSELLVRASRNRELDGDGFLLWERMESVPEHGSITVQLPRRKGRKAREAVLSVRFAPVDIRPPGYRRKGDGLEPLRLWAVYANETDPPKGEERVSWMLLTTLPVESFEDATEKIEWYVRRWVIELFFRVLKSGCKVEERQLRGPHNLKNAIALDCVIAWRILFLTLAGRGLPDLPASVVFDDLEWKAVHCFVNSTEEPPEREPSLQEVVRQVARLGGFIGRKGDGEPGMITLWRGMMRMVDIVATCRLFDVLPA